MTNSISEFLKTLDKEQEIVLSMDLDNTLVNRNKGDNFIPEDTFEIVKSLSGIPGFYLIPNTGRDIIGFASFIKENMDFPDAILGAGSLIKINGKYIFDTNSEIEWSVVQILLDGVKNGILPYIDLTHKEGRLIIYSDVNGLEFKDLFFSQNPRSWFGKELPPAVALSSLDKKIDFVFRIEFPVLPKHKELFDELTSRKENGIIYLVDILKTSMDKLGNYTVKRKAFFNEVYKGGVAFSRFEKHTDLSSKGHGIKRWISEKKLNNPIVIHVGDQDYGIINDTLVKAELPDAKLVMVGDRCKRDNPLVDLYLTGDIDKNIYNFLFFIYKLVEKNLN